MKGLEDLDVAGKRVLVRVDFNVPLDDQGRVTSAKRIEASLPTIDAIMGRDGRPVLVSHLGRPKGKRVASMSLRPVAAALAELGRLEVRFADDCVGAEVEALSRELGDGEVLLCENLRFHADEEKGDEDFGRRLARLGDVFVNDAFGTCHRAHASVAVLPRLLPSAPGLLLEKEIRSFQRVLEDPARPFVAVLGGAKVSDKLPVIDNLLPKIDVLIVGGAMAYTFLQAQGVPVGASRVEADLLDEARKVLARADDEGTRVLLPEDHVAALRFAEDSPYELTSPGIPEGYLGLDIGKAARKTFAAEIAKARTVVWNGPMGVFEWSEFRRGTEAVAEAVAACQGFTVVGGGDSVAAIELLRLEDKVDHVSTGGGASLELLEGKVLPGVAALAQG